MNRTLAEVKPSHLVTHLWIAWALVTLVFFLVLEFYEIRTGHVENTLSWNVWRAFRLQPHMRLRDHPAFWLLTLGLWLTMVTWLTGHLWFQWWR